MRVRESKIGLLIDKALNHMAIGDYGSLTHQESSAYNLKIRGLNIALVFFQWNGQIAYCADTISHTIDYFGIYHFHCH